MMKRGWSTEKVATLFTSLDENADGKLSCEELAVGLPRLRTGESTYKQLMAVVQPPVDVDFSDLATAPGGCLRIADTAHRAITLEQLERRSACGAASGWRTARSMPSTFCKTCIASNEESGGV